MREQPTPFWRKCTVGGCHGVLCAWIPFFAPFHIPSKNKFLSCSFEVLSCDVDTLALNCNNERRRKEADRRKLNKKYEEINSIGNGYEILKSAIKDEFCSNYKRLKYSGPSFNLVRQ